MPVVNPNANMFRIADIGGALQKKGQIEYGRMRNEALGMDIEEAQNMLKNRARAREIRMEFERAPDQVRELNKEGMFKQADEVAKNHLAMAQAQLSLSKSFSEGLTAENYDRVKQDALDEGLIDPGLWPDKYDPNWFKAQNSKNASALTKLTRKWEEQGIIMSQDLMQSGGEIKWTGEPYADPDDDPKSGAGADNWKGWTATDSNTLSKTATRMFGTYNPVNGEYAILDRDMAQKVQGLQTAAEDYYVKGRNRGDDEMTHAKALTLAAQDMNIQIPNVTGMAKEDPAFLNDTEAGRRRQQQQQ